MSHNHSHHHHDHHLEHQIESYVKDKWKSIDLKEYELEFVHDGETNLLPKENKIVIGLHEMIHLFNELKDKNIAPKNEEILASYMLFYNVGRAKHKNRKMLHMMKYDLLRECRYAYEETNITSFMEFYQNILDISLVLETEGWKLGYESNLSDVNKEEYMRIANHLYFYQVKQLNSLLFTIISDLQSRKIAIDESVLKQVEEIKQNQENQVLENPIVF